MALSLLTKIYKDLYIYQKNSYFYSLIYECCRKQFVTKAVSLKNKISFNLIDKLINDVQPLP